MSDRNLMILGAVVGAAVGVGVGFALFTERGRRLRSELQPEIESVIKEAVRLTQMVSEFQGGQAVANVANTAAAATWPRRAQ